MKVPLPSDTLANWLHWLECLHPTEIEMGLARVSRVAERAQLRPKSCPIIIVGGTNGKGSTVALLSQIYHRAGYRVGSYSSPHVDVFNERMCVNGDMLSDEDIVQALHFVESARAEDTLTYFEYTTLAAMAAFKEQGCDVVVLEVGLGGRLDATNIWDNDCAILTSIALDHQDYLGDTLAAVAFEKVAIGRAGKPFICGELSPPPELAEHAQALGVEVQFIDPDKLPHSVLRGDHQRRNAACALAAVEALQAILPVSTENIAMGLQQVYMPCRFEHAWVDGVELIMDVAHNPAAAITVCEALQAHFPNRAVFVVFSALKDKDISGVVEALVPVVQRWYCGQLSTTRAATLEQITTAIEAHTPKSGIVSSTNLVHAWLQASADVKSSHYTVQGEAPLVLVAGSFYTLTSLREYWQQQGLVIKRHGDV